jgi:hypothetical protein
MASIDEELSTIERDIRTLKIEYEQYFGGGRPRPPADTQWRCENLIKRYAERVAELSTGQRFRYNNLTSTYAKYQDMWRKKMMQKESGTTQHHYGSAAKAIEAERARAAARQQAAAPPATPAASLIAEPAVTVAVAEAAAEAASRAAEIRQNSDAFATTFSDPERDKAKVRQLYDKLIEARTSAGEKTGAPSLKDFERFVHQKTSDLKTKGGQAVEYTVSVEGGRVKLKARISN